MILSLTCHLVRMMSLFWEVAKGSPVLLFLKHAQTPSSTQAGPQLAGIQDANALNPIVIPKASEPKFKSIVHG